jgi:hypothetical protein
MLLRVASTFPSDIPAQYPARVRYALPLQCAIAPGVRSGVPLIAYPGERVAPARTGSRLRQVEVERLGGRFNTALAMALAAGRLALGAAIWAAPRPALATLGFDPDEPQVRTLGRLTGTRDIATGALAVAALRDARETRRVALLNAAIDAGDAAAFALALREHGPAAGRGATVGASAALAASLAGALLATRLGDKS